MILSSARAASERRNGELRVDREIFLRAPAEYLAFAGDLADAAMHAAQLEQESAYLRQIHELMTMVDAEAVSERITTTVLGHPRPPVRHALSARPAAGALRGQLQQRPRISGDAREFLPGVPPDILQQALASSELFAVSRDGSTTARATG